MRNISKCVARCLGIDSQAGVTAIEYGMIAGLIAVAILSAVTLVGTNLDGLSGYIVNHVAAPRS